jgi:hypothetical protein
MMCVISVNDYYNYLSEEFCTVDCYLWADVYNKLYSRALQKKKVIGLERGPLSLVSTTEELLDRKVAAPV